MHIPGEVKFLVCVDSSDECKAALRFACMRAKNSKGSVCILYVIEPNDMQHFAGVEKVMEREAEEEANSCLLYTSPSPRDRTRSRMPSSA